TASSTGNGGSSKIGPRGSGAREVIDWKFTKAAEEGADLRELDTEKVAAKITDTLAGANPDDYAPTRDKRRSVSHSMRQMLTKSGIGVEEAPGTGMQGPVLAPATSLTW